MPQEIMNIVWSALGIIVTGLVTFGVSKFTCWINSKMKDEKAAKYLCTITTLVGDAVKEVYQTYVEAIKGTDAWTKEAQEEALNKCLVKIKSELAPDVIAYATENYGDITEYLKTIIESTIYSLKNN